MVLNQIADSLFKAVLGKVIMMHLLKLCHLWCPHFAIMFTRACHWTLFQSQMNPASAFITTLLSCPFQYYPGVYYSLNLPGGLFHIQFSDYNFVYMHISDKCLTCITHRIRLHLITQIMKINRCLASVHIICCCHSSARKYKLPKSEEHQVQTGKKIHPCLVEV